MQNEMVEIQGTITHETEEFILLTDGDIEVKLPLSLIEYDYNCGVGDMVVVEVPKWMAIDKNLV